MSQGYNSNNTEWLPIQGTDVFLSRRFQPAPGAATIPPNPYFTTRYTVGDTPLLTTPPTQFKFVETNNSLQLVEQTTAPVRYTHSVTSPITEFNASGAYDVNANSYSLDTVLNTSMTAQGNMNLTGFLDLNLTGLNTANLKSPTGVTFVEGRDGVYVLSTNAEVALQANTNLILGSNGTATLSSNGTLSLQSGGAPLLVNASTGNYELDANRVITRSTGDTSLNSVGDFVIESTAGDTKLFGSNATYVSTTNGSTNIEGVDINNVANNVFAVVANTTNVSGNSINLASVGNSSFNSNDNLTLGAVDTLTVGAGFVEINAAQATDISTIGAFNSVSTLDTTIQATSGNVNLAGQNAVNLTADFVQSSANASVVNTAPTHRFSFDGSLDHMVLFRNSSTLPTTLLLESAAAATRPRILGQSGKGLNVGDYVTGLVFDMPRSSVFNGSANALNNSQPDIKSVVVNFDTLQRGLHLDSYSRDIALFNLPAALANQAVSPSFITTASLPVHFNHGVASIFEEVALAGGGFGLRLKNTVGLAFVEVLVEMKFTTLLTTIKPLVMLRSTATNIPVGNAIPGDTLSTVLGTNYQHLQGRIRMDTISVLQFGASATGTVAVNAAVQNIQLRLTPLGLRG